MFTHRCYSSCLELKAVQHCAAPPRFETTPHRKSKESKGIRDLSEGVILGFSYLFDIPLPTPILEPQGHQDFVSRSQGGVIELGVTK